MIVYLYAIGANICFALGSQVFTHFSIKIGPIWMNWFKASIACLCFFLALTITGSWVGVELKHFALLFLSGFIGLGIGDIFLLRAFSKIGPGRTLILFSFQPLLFGVFGYYFFNQMIDVTKLWAILFFIICVFLFSLESWKRSGHWEREGILMAFFGMIFDAAGVLITRYVFDTIPALNSFEANFYRTIGAITALTLASFVFIKIKEKTGSRVKLISTFIKLSPKQKLFVIVGSILGTFLSLSLYLNAVKYAHLASLSGVVITGTLFSSLFECILAKELPTRYLILATFCFLLGMKLLIF